MLSGCETPSIGEVQVLRDEKPTCALRSSPDIGVRPAAKSFVECRVHIETQRSDSRCRRERQVLVELVFTRPSSQAEWAKEQGDPRSPMRPQTR